jgi:hypothetical protein
MNDLETCIVAVYCVTATFSACALAYVLRQALNDINLSRLEPPSIRKWRKIAFGTAAYFLLFTIYFKGHWLVHPSLVAVGVVAIGFMASVIFILTVNSLSLRSRQTPVDRTGIRIANVAPARLRGPRYP